MKKIALLGLFLMSINASAVMASDDEDKCNYGIDATNAAEMNNNSNEKAKVDNRDSMDLRQAKEEKK